MKKKVWFLVPMIIVAVLLFMFRTTGLKVHMGVSVVGLLLLVAYTLATKKEWNNPILEILERVCYAVALITGVLLMNVSGVAVVSIVHKVSAVLFVIFLIAVEIGKSIKN